MIERKLRETPEGAYCPERATLALVGQKWVPHIISELMDGTRRFNELAVLVGGCNSRTLRDRLEVLESLGVVQRTIVATMPPWVEYRLTDSGRELGGALAPLRSWGRAHLSTAETVTAPTPVAPVSTATTSPAPAASQPAPLSPASLSPAPAAAATPLAPAPARTQTAAVVAYASIESAAVSHPVALAPSGPSLTVHER